MTSFGTGADASNELLEALLDWRRDWSDSTHFDDTGPMYDCEGAGIGLW